MVSSSLRDEEDQERNARIAKGPSFEVPLTPAERLHHHRSETPVKHATNDAQTLATALASSLPRRSTAQSDRYAPQTPLTRLPFTPALKTPRVAAPLLPCSQCTLAQDQIINLQSRLHTLDIEHLAAQERVLQVQREKAEVEYERKNAEYEREKLREEVARLRAILEAKADGPHPDQLAAQQMEYLQYKLYMEKLHAMFGDTEAGFDPEATLDALESLLEKVGKVMPPVDENTVITLF